MATVVETTPRTLTPEQRVVLRNLGWEGYETILGLIGNGHVRVTYDRGDLELMSPSYDQEAAKIRLGRIVETVTEELRIPCRGAGSTTRRLKAKDRGLEPDECFYLVNLFQRGGRAPDLSVDRPPDLAIEVEISRSALNRMGIYAALGVPEVWRFDGETLRVAHLQADGHHANVAVSPGLPFLSPDEIGGWLRPDEAIDDDSEWGRQLREWVRNELAPRIVKGPQPGMERD